jgi:hypothetical protein
MTSWWNFSELLSLCAFHLTWVRYTLYKYMVLRLFPLHCYVHTETNIYCPMTIVCSEKRLLEGKAGQWQDYSTHPLRGDSVTVCYVINCRGISHEFTRSYSVGKTGERGLQSRHAPTGSRNRSRSGTKIRVGANPVYCSGYTRSAELCHISSGYWTRLPKWKWPECPDRFSLSMGAVASVVVE